MVGKPKARPYRETSIRLNDCLGLRAMVGKPKARPYREPQ
jgi:hypothetical protein